MWGRGKLVHRVQDPPSFRGSEQVRRRGGLLSPRSPRSPHKAGIRWAATCGITIFTALCVLLSIYVISSYWKINSKLSGTQGEAESYYHRTLSFEVCNGMSNQRLSVLYGVIIASELGRIPVLPGFLLSGVQWTGAATTALDNSVPMETLYDVRYFMDLLDAMGMEVLHPRDAPPASMYMHVDIAKMQDPVEELAVYRSTKHLKIGCPLFKLPSYYFFGANTRLMWATLNGLRPNNKLGHIVSSIVNKMKSFSSEKRYNFVHLRIEQDWILHCKRWTHIRDGHIRNNCDNNTETIDEVLMSLNVKNTDPVYVASFWEQVDPEMGANVMNRLRNAGYQVFTSRDFKMHLSPDREVNALIDYEISLQSFKLVGNSVSTFTTLSIFQRRHLGRWSSYYNGGNIPMADFLPMDMLPWVFTYSSYNPQWDYMMKAAVKSATRHRTMKPICIYSGNTSAPIFQWMSDHGVTFIFHQPSWSDDLWKRSQAMGTTGGDPFYSNQYALESDFVRMDLPILPELEQYIYVLYTEPDIFFHKKVTVSSFPLPLPEVFGMAADPSSADGVDGGVMLVNLPAARKSYNQFKDFVFSYPGGPRFLKGPGIVGAYLEHYGERLMANRIAESYAAKPFKENDPAATIVHWQGPKPHDYWQYYLTKECPQGDTLCESGFASSGLCYYVKKWRVFLNESEDEVGQALWYACTGTYAEHLKTFCNKPPPPRIKL